jgi:hypothetical protein
MPCFSWILDCSELMIPGLQPLDCSLCGLLSHHSVRTVAVPVNTTTSA